MIYGVRDNNLYEIEVVEEDEKFIYMSITWKNGKQKQSKVRKSELKYTIPYNSEFGCNLFVSLEKAVKFIEEKINARKKYLQKEIDSLDKKLKQIGL